MRGGAVSKQMHCIYVSEEELLAATRRGNILNVWNGEDTRQLKHRLMLEHKNG